MARHGSKKRWWQKNNNHSSNASLRFFFHLHFGQNNATGPNDKTAAAKVLPLPKYFSSQFCKRGRKLPYGKVCVLAIMTSMKRVDSKVRFNDNAAIRHIIEQAQEVMEDANEGIWYTPNELKTLKKQQQVAGDEDNDNPIDPVEEKRRRERRQQFVQSVLETQTEHKKMGINDPKGLRAISRAASKTSRLVAEESAMINHSESLNGISDKLVKKGSRSGLRRCASANNTAMRRNASFSKLKAQGARPNKMRMMMDEKQQQHAQRSSHRDTSTSIFDESIFSSLEIA